MSAGFRKVAALVNPVSGTKSGRQTTENALERLARRGVEVVMIAGDSEEHARELVRAVVSDPGYDALVVCGGDGMVSMVVDELGDSRTPVAVVPTGTGNDLARQYGLPIDDPDAAADLVLDGVVRPVDLGRVTDDSGDVRYFSSILCAGLDSEVSARVNSLRWVWGKARYVISTLLEFPRYKPVDMRITVDGEEAYEGPVLLSAYAITRFYGGSMEIAPQADPTDGLLDLVYVPGRSRLKLLKNFPKVYSGTHLGLDAVGTARGKVLRIEQLSGAPLLAHADGDSIAHLPITVDVVPGGLHLVQPAGVPAPPRP